MIIDTDRCDLAQLAVDYRLWNCLACGKCTSSCTFLRSAGDIRQGKSPRVMVERVLTDPDILSRDLIWFCPTCDVCTERCPAGIKLRDLIEELRRCALLLGHDEHCTPCRECGRPFVPSDVHEMLLRRLKADTDLTLLLSTCPSCRSRSYARMVRKTASGLSRSDAVKPAG